MGRSHGATQNQLRVLNQQVSVLLYHTFCMITGNSISMTRYLANITRHSYSYSAPILAWFLLCDASCLLCICFLISGKMECIILFWVIFSAYFFLHPSYSVAQSIFLYHLHQYDSVYHHIDIPILKKIEFFFLSMVNISVAFSLRIPGRNRNREKKNR